MKKLNNKGFVLAETLIVAVFLMTVFSIIYNNFYPLIGEYERREYYDDIDSKYAIYWIKKMVQDKDYVLATDKEGDRNEKLLKYFGYKPDSFELVEPAAEDKNKKEYFYVKFSCNNFRNASKQKVCKTTLDRAEIAYMDDGTPAIFITAYRTTKFKELVEKDDTIVDADFRDYIVYLPEYRRAKSLNMAEARVIAKFHKQREDNDYYTYATMEVIK